MNNLTNEEILKTTGMEKVDFMFEILKPKLNYSDIDYSSINSEKITEIMITKYPAFVNLLKNKNIDIFLKLSDLKQDGSSLYQNLHKTFLYYIGPHLFEIMTFTEAEKQTLQDRLSAEYSKFVVSSKYIWDKTNYTAIEIERISVKKSVSDLLESLSTLYTMFGILPLPKNIEQYLKEYLKNKNYTNGMQLKKILESEMDAYNTNEHSFNPFVVKKFFEKINNDKKYAKLKSLHLLNK